MASEDITPVVVIVAAIFWTKADQGLSVAEAFTSLSIISIAAAPLVNILISIVQVFGAIGCFTRLQAFLKLEERQDLRETAGSSIPSTPSTAYRSSLALTPDLAGKPTFTTNGGTLELDSVPPPSINAPAFGSIIPTVAIEDATFVVAENIEVLENISMTFATGTVSMIVGRVGCGKSSLLKAIAGELTMTKGRIIANVSSMAYCDQAPWLQNSSIRDNIVGQSTLDETWLQTVIESCALDEDIAQFPLRDLTIVGSGGVSLSGGQKQRVVRIGLFYALFPGPY